MKASYSVSGTYKNYYWNPPSPYIDFSSATKFMVDIYPLTQTPSQYNEPIMLKLSDQAGGAIYEVPVRNLNAGLWNTVTVDLTGIPAANRMEIKQINLYLWTGFSNEINGRTAVEYYFDHIRLGGSKINGFEKLSQWSGEAVRAANTSIKTEGAQSCLTTYTISGTWVNHYWNTGNTQKIDLSEASRIKFDIRPTSQTPAGNNEPLVFKVADDTGVIYEQQITRLTANQWTTVTIDISGIAKANRKSVKQFNFYVYTAFTSAINGRTSIQYYMDNLCAN